jgi:hypothetical protein
VSALQQQVASSLRINPVNGSSWSTQVPTSACTPAGLYGDAKNGPTTTSAGNGTTIRTYGWLPLPQFGSTSGSHMAVCRSRCHTPSSVWIFSPILASWWTAETTNYWMESRRGQQCGMSMFTMTTMCTVTNIYCLQFSTTERAWNTVGTPFVEGYGTGVECSVIATGTPPIVLLGYDVEHRRSGTLGAASCAILQHGVELGFGDSEPIWCQLLWLAGDWWARYSPDVVDSIMPDLTRPARVQHEVRHNTVHHIWTIPGPQGFSCRD